MSDKQAARAESDPRPRGKRNRPVICLLNRKQHLWFGSVCSYCGKTKTQALAEHRAKRKAVKCIR